jgi:HSP20 family protein
MNTVSLYRPITIEKALNDFDRYMESFFGEPLLAPAGKTFNYLPAVDVQETEGAYLMEADLPGFDEKDIQVHLDRGNLTIESRKEETGKAEKKDGQEGNYLIRERRTSSFSRSFKLPENADPESVSAAFKNGILRLEIKKRPETQKRLIPIEAK